MAKILIIDDDESLCGMVKDWLEHDNHIVECVHCGAHAMEQLKLYPYDVILLDWDLPDTSGVELLNKFRSTGGVTPIIFLTGHTSSDDKEKGLDCGADDYVTKPFDTKELAARIRALLRRPQQYVEPVMQVGDVTVNRSKHLVLKNGVEVKLFRREFALLDFLLRNPDRVFSAEELLDHVWNSEAGVSSETVRTSVARVRKQLDTPGKPSVIENVRGFGYKIGGGG
ncbi:MAG: response regulator transcription factor [Cyanobacteria bacterium SZAS LIN-2]|nr:response regulator transcription factor [Cyanobacteria bacterium SZAS LIN-3]MBS1995322.1 response regulator transcription factor [Cyanobacteria bacterium SZAS LIN-2]